MTVDENNPYRFTAAELERKGDDSASTFRQPAKGRKLDAKDVRRLAYAQRGLLVCAPILGVNSVVALAMQFALRSEQAIAQLGEPLFQALFVPMAALGVAALIALPAGLFFCFAVGRRIHSILLAFGFVVLSLPTPLTLPVYLYLHFRANYVLKRHGVAVGWLGAKFRSLPKADAQPIVESLPA